MTRARDLAAGTFEQATGGVLKLETSDTTVTDGSVLGKIEFKAPDEASGTDAILVGAAIEAVAEGTFAADNNATELVFKTGASAAAAQQMTLTSGGNLLVNKASDDNNAGISLRATGEGYFVRSGANALALNRLSDDGDIINFFKDTSAVGAIGTNSNGNFQLFGAAASHVGLQFGSPSILPINNSGASSNGAVDLGDANVRFKDLYLSGGVYLGGTGAANKLDDYEEGTWTITDGSGAGLSFTVQDNVYTKVGRLVVASAIITWPSTSDTRIARIALPFTSVPNNSHSGGVVTEQNWDTSITLIASCNYTTGVIFRQRGGGSLTNANLSGKKLRFSVTYHAA